MKQGATASRKRKSLFFFLVLADWSRLLTFLSRSSIGIKHLFCWYVMYYVNLEFLSGAAKAGRLSRRQNVNDRY